MISLWFGTLKDQCNRTEFSYYKVSAINVEGSMNITIDKLTREVELVKCNLSYLSIKWWKQNIYRVYIKKIKVVVLKAALS